jgi:hypothetical protein
MKALLLAGMVALVFAGEAQARSYAAVVSDNGYYTKVDGHRVHRPVHANARPRGASARCGDGSYSFSQHRRGTCSHHGGVSQWF